MGNVESWLPLLTGGLAGSILTLIGGGLLRWLSRPLLKIDFAPDVAGCDVQTPAQIQARAMVEVGGLLQQHYVRLRIQNVGCTVARSVTVQVTRIVHANLQGVKTIFDSEILDLKVGLVGGTAVALLPKQGYRFFDVAHVTETDAVAKHEFDAVATPMRLADLRLGCGTYEATVFVAAESADSVTQKIRWRWDGTISGLEIVRD